jgi:hypothetical protein
MHSPPAPQSPSSQQYLWQTPWLMSLSHVRPCPHLGPSSPWHGSHRPTSVPSTG